MKLKNEELVARRMRSEADESQYREQEEARRIAQAEQRAKLKQKREDDTRIQSAIEYGPSKSNLRYNSKQREETRQRKLGKSLEWDQDKPTLDEDGVSVCYER